MRSATPEAPSFAPWIGRPVCQIEDPLRRRRIDAREDVAEPQRVARRRHMRPALHNDAVGALLHLGDDPVARTLVRAAPRDSWAEG